MKGRKRKLSRGHSSGRRTGHGGGGGGNLGETGLSDDDVESDSDGSNSDEDDDEDDDLSEGGDEIDNAVAAFLSGVVQDEDDSDDSDVDCGGGGGDRDGDVGSTDAEERRPQEGGGGVGGGGGCGRPKLDDGKQGIRCALLTGVLFRVATVSPRVEIAIVWRVSDLRQQP